MRSESLLSRSLVGQPSFYRTLYRLLMAWTRCRRSMSAVGLWVIVLLATVSCGTDEFRVIEGAGSDSASGGLSGDGGKDCCGGVGASEQASGGTDTSGSGGTGAEGVCSLTQSYCALDWVGLWGAPGFEEGVGDSARFSELSGVASAGEVLYISHGHGISAVDSQSRTVSLLAGAEESGDVDALGADARFKNPTGLLAHEGYLYVSDTGNRKLKRVSLSTGQVSTYSQSLISSPAGLELLPADGNAPAYLLIADEALHIILRLEIADKAPTPGILAGTHGMAGSNSVLLNRPFGIARIGKRLFITERGNHWVRSLDLSRPAPISLDEEWGDGAPGFGEGRGEAALLSDPTGIAAVGESLLVVDHQNSVIRRGTRGGDLGVVLGMPGSSEHLEGAGSEARLEESLFLHVGPEGNAFLGAGTVLRRISL